MKNYVIETMDDLKRISNSITVYKYALRNNNKLDITAKEVSEYDVDKIAVDFIKRAEPAIFSVTRNNLHYIISIIADEIDLEPISEDDKNKVISSNNIETPTSTDAKNMQQLKKLTDQVDKVSTFDFDSNRAQIAEQLCSLLGAIGKCATVASTDPKFRDILEHNIRTVGPLINTYSGIYGTVLKAVIPELMKLDKVLLPTAKNLKTIDEDSVGMVSKLQLAIPVVTIKSAISNLKELFQFNK